MTGWLILAGESVRGPPYDDLYIAGMRDGDAAKLREAFHPQAWSDRDVTETVTLLARMARFIVADLTEPSSIPKELEAFVPDLAVPVQPLLAGADRPFSMFKDYWKYDWVLPVVRYESREMLVSSLRDHVIAPAETKLLELRRRRLTALA